MLWRNKKILLILPIRSRNSFSKTKKNFSVMIYKIPIMYFVYRSDDLFSKFDSWIPSLMSNLRVRFKSDGPKISKTNIIYQYSEVRRNQVYSKAGVSMVSLSWWLITIQDNPYRPEQQFQVHLWSTWSVPFLQHSQSKQQPLHSRKNNDIEMVGGEDKILASSTG